MAGEMRSAYGLASASQCSVCCFSAQHLCELLETENVLLWDSVHKEGELHMWILKEKRMRNAPDKPRVVARK